MSLSQFVDDLFPAGSVTGGLATLSLAVAIGIAFGNIRVKGVRLGIAAVLFSALLFAQFGLTIDPHVLEYFRDFGLVLFVYALGLQMGPGFFSSFKAEGLRLNILAISVVLLGALMTGLIVHYAHLPKGTAAGLFTGGFATTPALAAGEEAIRNVSAARHLGNAAASLAQTDLAYSVAYPFGLTGPILLVLIFRMLFRVKIGDELKALNDAELIRRPPQGVADIEVTHPNLVGVTLRDNRFMQTQGVIFTRLLRDNHQVVPNATTAMNLGDIFRAVGPSKVLDELIPLMGRQSVVNLAEATGTLHREDLVVTHSGVLGKSLRELNLINRHGVTLTRIQRSGVDMPSKASLTLHFGDSVTAVGPVEGMKKVEAELGNSTAALNQTQLIPIFLGIWLGAIAGSVPLAIPGLHTSVRIGLAGGPMLVAIALSRLGNIGSVIWYMPTAANQILRDFGMAVFLACVGFQSGDHFFQKIAGHDGLILMAWGASITTVPMLLVGIFGRLILKLNFITLSGLTAGAMTSSPTLLFANETTKSTSPAVAYAAVYPLSMLIPVFCAQLLVTLLLN